MAKFREEKSPFGNAKRGCLEIDQRIPMLIENGIALNHRTMIVIVGDQGRKQVPVLYDILQRAKFVVDPTILWCYKSELGFPSNPNAYAKNLDNFYRQADYCLNDYDMFCSFQSKTKIEYCYYRETQRILGRTYDICVLQDFEAITPNILARTVETVGGGGLIIFLLKTMTSLTQLYNLCMDVHSKFVSDSNINIVSRFNERFLLSLPYCKCCLITDGLLRILPITNFEINKVKEVGDQANEDLSLIKDSFADSNIISPLVDLCKTVDQAKAVLVFMDCITEKSLRYTISLTAARGRGKSAAMGIAVAGAVAFNYSNIIVTSPDPCNLSTFFQFVLKGFDALGYKEHVDYGLIRSTEPGHKKALIRVNVFKNNRQTIMYINPLELAKVYHAEIVIVDEAAAIPIRHIKKMFGPYLLFLSSTTEGYEGTGRSLSGKLIKELRQQSQGELPDDKLYCIKRELKEISLNESIRYKPHDPVESWLNKLLCLYACNDVHPLNYFPAPQDCRLYYINRDTLFSSHKSSELFLQKIMSLYISSHYKNSPNDLQLMSDGPTHHLFCLLGPIKNGETIPDIYCFILVCLEGGGQIHNVENKLFRGVQSIGNLIPFVMLEHFNNKDFSKMTGLRIVNISTHPLCQRMGYGSRAIALLESYFNKDFPVKEGLGTFTQNTNLEQTPTNEGNLIKELIKPRSNLPPLLQTVNERAPEDIDYIGVYFSLSLEVLKFMKKCGFTEVYVGQTKSYLTEEFDCLMLKVPNISSEKEWLQVLHTEYVKRQLNVLSFSLRELPTTLAVTLLLNSDNSRPIKRITKGELNYLFSNADIHRLQHYLTNLLDHHVIKDLLPRLTKIAIENQFDIIDRYFLQYAILCGVALQCKTVEDVFNELQIDSTQGMGLFNRWCKRIMNNINKIQTEDEEEENGESDSSEEEDFSNKNQIKTVTNLRNIEWNKALADAKTPPSVVSVKRVKDVKLEAIKNSIKGTKKHLHNKYVKQNETRISNNINHLVRKYKIPKFQLKGETPPEILTTEERTVKKKKDKLDKLIQKRKKK